jgi:transcriptional regulator with XRE-family HTH domain
MMRGNQGEEALAIGKRLRAIRRAQNATLADVSARAGVSISALSKIENAQISASYDILKRACDALGVGSKTSFRPRPRASFPGARR